MVPEEGALFLLPGARVIIEPRCGASDARPRHCHAHLEDLGGLPLALDQAGAYIEETGCGLRATLTFTAEAREATQAERGGLGPDHPESVATTFALSFEKVASASRAAADLLRLCAFLLPDAIPEEIFTEGAAELDRISAPVAADPLKLDAAFAESLKYSLLRRDADAKTLGIHRLVPGSDSRWFDGGRKAPVGGARRAGGEPSLPLHRVCQLGSVRPLSSPSPRLRVAYRGLCVRVQRSGATA